MFVCTTLIWFELDTKRISPFGPKDGLAFLVRGREICGDLTPKLAKKAAVSASFGLLQLLMSAFAIAFSRSLILCLIFYANRFSSILSSCSQPR